MIINFVNNSSPNDYFFIYKNKANYYILINNLRMSNDRNPYYNVRRVTNRCNQIDTHELLKREIMKQSAEGSDQGYRVGLTPQRTEIQQISDPTPQPAVPARSDTGIEDTYIYFDSQAKELVSDMSNGLIEWNITTLNNSKPIENIIQMKIGSFYLPLISNSTSLPDYYFFRRVYMKIETLPTAQAIRAQNNQSFHFEFDVDNLSSIAVKLTPIEDTYYFSRPVVSLDQLQVRFLVPLNFRKISLPKDDLSVTAIAGTNPGQFRVNGLDTTASIGSVGVPTAPGVAAFFSEFISSNATLNNLVNDLNGAFITNIISTTTFSVTTFDFTTVLTNIDCRALIGKNRICIPLRFTSVRDVKTNYLTGTHV